MSNENSLANRLRAAREHAGLSQGQVARLFKVARPTISEIEAGRRKVTSDELKQFAKIYDTGINWLLNEESEIDDPAVELAARELVKMKPEDLQSVLKLLKTLRRPENRK